jgi:tetratricopeptide (TPR) repeat protein
MKVFITCAVCLIGVLSFSPPSLSGSPNIGIIDYKDEWTKTVALGEVLNTMGISCQERVYHPSPRDMDVVIIGSMATNSPQIRQLINGKSTLISSFVPYFVKEGGFVIELMQSFQDDAEPDRLPEGLGFSRVDSSVSEVVILKPEHRLFNVPNKITEDDLRFMTLAKASGSIVGQAGFQVLAAQDNAGKQPVIMTARHGLGEIMVLSLAPDKQYIIGETPEIREKALKLMQNVMAYARGFNAADDKGRLIVKSDIEPVVWFDSGDMIDSVRFSPDGRLLAAARRGVKLWDMKTGAEVGGFQQELARSISFSPDGNLLAFSGEASLRLWDVKKNREIELGDRIMDPEDFCFSPDGKLLAAVSGGPGRGGIVLLDVESRRNLRKTDFEEGFPKSMCFSPDVEVLVGARSYQAMVWEVATGQKLSTFSASGGPYGIRACRFSPDGNVLALGGEDGKIALWNVVTGEDVRRKMRGAGGDYPGYSDAPVSFSHDLELVAFVCDYDETPSRERWERRKQQPRPPGQAGLYVIRIFETETGEEIWTLTGHTDEIHSIDFSPDGKMLVSGSWDGKVMIWKLDPAVQLPDANTLSIIKHQTIIDTGGTEEGYDMSLTHEALAGIYAGLGLESAAAHERSLAVKVQYPESYHQEYLEKTRQPTVEDYLRDIRSQQAIISEKTASEDVARARYLVGKLYQKMQDREKALKTYQEVINEYPETGLALLSRRAMGTCTFESARNEFDAGANQAAILSLKEALEDREDMCWAAEARRLLADIYLQEKDERSALQEYRKLIELHPLSRWIYLQRTRGGQLSPSDASEIATDLEQSLEKD